MNDVLMSYKSEYWTVMQNSTFSSFTIFRSVKNDTRCLTKSTENRLDQRAMLWFFNETDVEKLKFYRSALSTIVVVTLELDAFLTQVLLTAYFLDQVCCQNFNSRKSLA